MVMPILSAKGNSLKKYVAKPTVTIALPMSETIFPMNSLRLSPITIIGSTITWSGMFVKHSFRGKDPTCKDPMRAVRVILRFWGWQFLDPFAYGSGSTLSEIEGGNRSVWQHLRWGVVLLRSKIFIWELRGNGSYEAQTWKYLSGVEWFCSAPKFSFGSFAGIVPTNL